MGLPLYYPAKGNKQQRRKNPNRAFCVWGYTRTLRARMKKQLMCLNVCVCVCVCVSKLFELAKDKTLKVAEKVKFLCKLFNVSEYVFTQHIVF